MADKLPYRTTSEALRHPAKDALRPDTAFFKGWNRDIDVKNHDLLCAEMSRLAYASQDVVRGALQGIGFDAVDFFGGESLDERTELGGTQGFVTHCSSGGPAVLAFRGTEPDKLEDLVSDLKSFQRTSPHFPGCQIHAGFADLWDLVRDDVLRLAAPGEGGLLLTGHSLGAALATLAAVETKAKALITFGSPRVGDEKLAGLLKGVEVRRHVNCCDLIARLPPERFDRQHLTELFAELAQLKGTGWIGTLLGRASAALFSLFRRAGVDPRYAHVPHQVYGDRLGAVRDRNLNPELSPAAIREDQGDARRAYVREHPNPLRESLKARFQEIRRFLSARGSGEGSERLRSFFRLLFSSGESTVPLRDLADHAPVNYVSLFTGRS